LLDPGQINFNQAVVSKCQGRLQQDNLCAPSRINGVEIAIGGNSNPKENMPVIHGHKVTISAPATDGSREFSYQIDDEKVQEIDCGDAQDALRIVTRILDARHDPRNIAEKPKTPPGTPKPVVFPPAPKGFTPDGKPVL
jgi:hypothetical protein